MVELGVISTKLDTLDHIRVVLPNHYISENPIENWSTNGRRRIDLRMQIDIAADLPTARQTIEAELAATPRS